MTKVSSNRRDFLRVSALAGGGMLLGFNLLTACRDQVIDKLPPVVAAAMKAMPKDWVGVNVFLKIGENGLVSIMSPNPEIGQNVKTAMPMIVAEELDVDWADVIVEQAPLDTQAFSRQVAGGSQSIRQSWEGLRKAGATARAMLVTAAAQRWGVDAAECRTEKGKVFHPDGTSLSYGELASEAALVAVPAEVSLKQTTDFSIIGHSQRNVDLENILTGKPLYGLDYHREGMCYATALRPPAFGQELVDYDDQAAKAVVGVIEVLRLGDKIAVLATNTWAAMKGQRALKAVWKEKEKLEDTAYHNQELLESLDKLADQPRRLDGDIATAFAEADTVFERTYAAPFLPHSCMEPMNFFAHVTAEKVDLVGPIQTPEWTQNRVAELLKRPKEEVHIGLTRMGGGFGRRLYGDFVLEAAEISQLSGKAVQLVFSREDDMLAGTYRPASQYRFRAAIQAGSLVGWHLTEACYNGAMFDPMPNNFPAGTIDNFRIDSHQLSSNISTGAWRAPYANFLAFAEQAFLDELAQQLGQDPVQFRLDLFERAKQAAVGESNNYEIDKYVGVIRLVAEKAGWGKAAEGVYQGFSAYYSHNTYVAEVAEVVMEAGQPRVKKVHCAVDCGILINPDAAINQIEGGIIDGIGHAMYGDFSFEAGRSPVKNFDQYRLIRIDEAPEIAVYFVESQEDPTGLGEPSLPPAGGAVANALAAATGQRFYKQPFIQEIQLKG